MLEVLAGYDPAGALIEGDPKTPRLATEIWTFARSHGGHLT